MAEGNDHIAYEQKVRKENRSKEIKEVTAATLSKAFKPPRKVSPTKREEKLEKLQSHHSNSPKNRTSPDKAKNKIKVRVELENSKKSLKTEKSPHKHSSKEIKIKSTTY